MTRLLVPEERLVSRGGRPDGGSAPGGAPAAPDWDRLAPRGAYARLWRPALQWFGAAGLLVLALVPGLAIALVNLVVFRDPRQILFVQPRVGYRGRIFRIYKFRTMRAPRGSCLESWASGKDRERVTPFGRFLRNTHLDELPQLLNVLCGDMLLIGPRPEMVEIERWAASAVPGFSERLAIKPGLTGPAQVTQGYTDCSVAAYQRKLAINRAYLGRVTLWTDCGILVRTALWMLRGRGWAWSRGALVGMTWLLWSCQSPALPTSTTREHSVRAETSSEPLPLGAGDVLGIVVPYHPEFQSANGYRVSSAGTILLPIAGSVTIAGRTLEEARAAIEEALGRYVVDPDVGLTVIEHGAHRVYALGHVRSPGAQVLDRRMTAIELLALAGGPTEGARRDHVALLRRHGPEEVEVYFFDAETPGPAAMVSVQPGDVLFVPRSGAGVFRDEALPILQGVGFTSAQIAAVVVASTQL